MDSEGQNTLALSVRTSIAHEKQVKKAVGQEKNIHVQADSPSIFRYLYGILSDHPDLFIFRFTDFEIGRSAIQIIYRGIINKQKLGEVVLFLSACTVLQVHASS